MWRWHLMRACLLYCNVAEVHCLGRWCAGVSGMGCWGDAMVPGRHSCALEGNGLEEFIRQGQLGCGHNGFDCVLSTIE